MMIIGRYRQWRARRRWLKTRRENWTADQMADEARFWLGDQTETKDSEKSEEKCGP